MSAAALSAKPLRLSLTPPLFTPCARRAPRLRGATGGFFFASASASASVDANDSVCICKSGAKCLSHLDLAALARARARRPSDSIRELIRHPQSPRLATPLRSNSATKRSKDGCLQRVSLASVANDGGLPLTVTWPYGVPCAAMQSRRIHKPCAARLHEAKAGSSLQSDQKNLPQRSLFTSPPGAMRHCVKASSPPLARCTWCNGNIGE